MIPKRLIMGLDERRLRNFIALFFLALAVPTAALIWQAYGQLKWESFHQYRIVAEELTRRIDARLNEMVRAADARSFADYSFIVVAGDPSANLVQRSPLSEFPIAADLPGVLGHFQVDTDGAFSTPILPPEGTDAASLGISDSEYGDRYVRAADIHAVLVDNRLVQSRPQPVAVAGALNFAASPGEEIAEPEMRDDEEGRRVLLEFAANEAPTVASGSYSQQVFDELNRSIDADNAVAADEIDAATAANEESMVQARKRNTVIGKVSDLQLDAALEEKSQLAERQYEDEKERSNISYRSGARAKRTEQAALPESVEPVRRDLSSDAGGLADLRISTFESEIDPFEFSLLDSGHIVLFRKVWRNGERYIQGLLLNQEAFIIEMIGRQFTDTALSDMSSLIVAHNDDVIHTFSGRLASSYTDAFESLDGTLLYRRRLSAPLSSLELIFSINRLPPGAGASVLAWVTLIIAVVFVGGFLVLYRLGLSQINLARQQQDFVSAVSHELKTPLTSIRMYGEMLKEGWADEKKRQDYYEFIHDESERLSKLIANVLQLARITRNDPQFDSKPVNVGELMSITRSKIANQVERAGFELRFDCDARADEATLDMEEDCFAQIMINLVDNAIKFSKDADDRTIEINSRLTGDQHVEFSVRDYGPGIPKDQMRKIFQLFYRSESELTRETVGTGIGLAIVHQLTEAMGGSVDFVNAEPGAEFRVRFAVRRPDL
jgi:signal transduction histidine kinase